MVELEKNGEVDATTRFALSKKYMHEGAGTCPICGSKNLEGSTTEGPDCDQIWMQIECLECNATWNDIYKLIGIGEIKPKKMMP